ncbi:MAG: PepSY domain-containing protein [Pseudoxanthomonas sp.]
MISSRMTFTTLIFCSLLLSATAHAAQKQDPKLLAQARVSESQARATALAKVPSGIVSSAELEREHHHLVWSFDIARPNSTEVTEIQIDAKTGKIVSTKTESAADEAHEAAEDAKARSH